MKTAAPTLARPAEPARSPTRRPFIAGPVQRQAEEPAQARPAMGQRDDRWEREAERVADRATTGHPTGLARGVTPVTGALLRETQGPGAELERMTQPKADPEAGEEPPQAAEAEAPAQAQPETPVEEPAQADAPAQARAETPVEEPAQAADADDDTAPAEPVEPAQARATAPGAPPVTEQVAGQMAAARGRGDPLAAGLKRDLAARFGADFDGVRIHTDSAAVRITRALRAQAVTRGPDIFFNAGRFAPETAAGRHLLAHELTHTVQQGATGTDPLQRAEEPAEGGYDLRPEVVTAIGLAKGEAGKVNARKHGPDGKRIGHDRLRAYFETALGGPVIHPSILERVTPVQGPNATADALPSWCGIFTWWAMKSAGLPIPDWKLGAVPLDALSQRAAGELPRKGDIAIDVVPNNHFAMVTGLESATDAAGKPRRLVRVATINGNTAGEDNLGGQVQEKWHEIGHWDHFLDPVGKLSLPPAPAVRVERTPADDAAPRLPETPQTEAPAAAEAATVPAPDAEEPEPAVALPAEAAAAGEQAAPVVDLALPPRPDAGPAEAVAEVATVDLGTSAAGAVDAYLGAGPSAMAGAQPGFAAAVGTRLEAEQTELAENPPVLNARTSGLDNLPEQAPAQVAHPEAAIGDGTLGPDPGPLPDTHLPDPGPSTGNAQRESRLQEEDSGSFLDDFMRFLKDFTSGIRTRDDTISTAAGARPHADLSGEADASNMGRQRDEAATQVADARDAEVTAFRDHPGQSSIQPVKVEEERAAAIAPVAAGEPLAEAEDAGMADYAAAPIPADVRGLADQKVAATLAPKLEQPRADANDAARTRDADQSREIATAETAAADLSQATDSEQRRLVIENRGKVARLQGDGISEANAAVATLHRDAATKEGEARGEIRTHVTEEQGKADAEVAKGEVAAEGHKRKGEEDAAAEKARLEKEQEDQSWWDRAKSAIKSLVSLVTKAIDAVFTKVRGLVKDAIEAAKNAAIGLINAARTWVVDKINRFRDWAKTQVDTYLKDTFPGLAKRINGAIDSVADGAIGAVNKVADAAIAGVTALADGLAKALDKILSTFQTALKTAVRVAGAVATGDFAEALRAIVEGACEIAGVDPKPVFDFFDRAGKAVTTILRDPVGFIGKLFGAVGDGMAAFFRNIRTHLISGVIGWLTGALAEVQLTGPFEFTVSGILRIVLQVLGLTYAGIKARVVKAYPPAARVFDAVEKGFALVTKLVTQGPMALLEDILAAVSDFKEMVLGAIRSWLTVTAIKEGVVWLLALTNPASAIVKAIKLVFDLVMFLVERFQQIKDFVLSVYEAVAAVAAGNFAAVTKGVEEALARSIPVLVSLFASVLGLGGIAKQVTGIIRKVTAPIRRVVDAVVRKIVAFAKKIVAKVKAFGGAVKKKAKDTVRKLKEWWKVRRGFRDKSGAAHSLSYRGAGKAAKLTVASSNPLQIDIFLKDRAAKAAKGGTSYQPGDVAAADAHYQGPVRSAEAALSAAPKPSPQNFDANRALVDTLETALDQLGSTWLSRFFDASDEKDFPPPVLPVMSDGAKAKADIRAEYLIQGNGYRYGVNTGTESSAHKGNLHGWTLLQGAKLTRGSAKYVRMHVIPHLLGGDAVDSNLVPARGDLFNTPFSHAVEQPAIRDISGKGDKTHWKPIWYHFRISYYPAGTTPPTTWPASKPYPADAFPASLSAEWGHYKDRKAGEAITRDAPEKTTSDTPKLPDLSQTPAINLDGPTALMNGINQDSRFGQVTSYYVTDHLIAERQQAGKFAGEQEMADRLYANIRASHIGDSQKARMRVYVQKTRWAVQAGAVTMT